MTEITRPWLRPGWSWIDGPPAGYRLGRFAPEGLLWAQHRDGAVKTRGPEERWHSMEQALGFGWIEEAT